MTSADDISMFGSNLGLQPAISQPHLENFEDYSFAFDPANTATSCSHRKLQEVLDRGNPMTAMTSISKGQAEQTQAPQVSIASGHDNDIEGLKRYTKSGFSLIGTDQTRDVMEWRRYTEARVERLYDMFFSLVDTVAKQGVAIKQMIGDMPPDKSESFSRGFKEELKKLPKNLRSKP